MLEKIAYFVKNHFEGNLLGDYIVNFIRIRGIDEKLLNRGTRTIYQKDVMQPTTEMIQAREFFNKYKERVNNIVNLLYDEESKVCYQKAIVYRYTHEMNQAPKFTKQKYFVDEIIKLSTEEVFVDGGAFVGDTIRDFYKKSNGQYKRIIAFEPDEYNFYMLSKLRYHDVIKYNQGLWDESCELRFTNGGGCGSRMSENGGISVAVSKLDDVKECQDATFIKLDVEGSELHALKGAEKIIRKNHPKLAICLYHSNEDMLNIIEYIHEIEPRYHIYVRHHSISAAETVMYAVYNEENVRLICHT